MTSAGVVFGAAVVLGAGLVGVAFELKRRDQLRLDGERHCYDVRFPRAVSPAQVSSFLQVLVGLATPRFGVAGRQSAVLEVIGTRDEIHHRLALPAGSADYYVAELRAAIPGVTVLPVEPDTESKGLRAHELRLTDPSLPLSVADAAAASRTILASLGGLHRGDLNRPGFAGGSSPWK